MNYQQFGDQGLLRSRQSQNYTFEKKLAIVELYLTSELSYQEIALQEGICEPPLIAKWVSRFRAAGPEALRPHKQKKHKKKNEKKQRTNPEKILLFIHIKKALLTQVLNMCGNWRMNFLSCG